MPSLSREAQGKPRLYLILSGRGDISRGIEISRREFAEGKGIPSDEVFREMDEIIKG